ncbi:MAG: rhodanese-like domain-containing protein [Planctomycetes bacterium]|nr:rhodanese-like domain-containing protein [Planctomycetota bacterium]
MKQTALQVAAILGLTLLLGTAYNLATGKLEFFVSSGRYPNARLCKRAEAASLAGEPSGRQVAEAFSPSLVKPAPDGAPAVAPAPAVAAGDPPGGEGTAQPAASPADPPPPETLPLSAGGFPFVGFGHVFESWRDGLLIIDARSPRLYREGHIPGAVLIPAWEPRIEDRIAALRETEPVEAPVILYCSKSDDCEDSEIVAGNMRGLGFLDLSIYAGGFPEWVERGMPVAKGDDPGERGGGAAPFAGEDAGR